MLDEVMPVLFLAGLLRLNFLFVGHDCCGLASGHSELCVWPHHDGPPEAARHGVCRVGLQAR